jgi:hypothetical protein
VEGKDLWQVNGKNILKQSSVQCKQHECSSLRCDTVSKHHIPEGLNLQQHYYEDFKLHL